MIIEEDSEQRFTILAGDAKDRLKDIKAGTIDCIFTSPDPIRTYGQFLDIVLILGLECKRILKPTGSIWVHMEDAFDEQGSMMRWPAKFSMEMVSSSYNWILRAERIWHLPVGDMGYFNEGKFVDNNRLILDHSYLYHFTNARYGYYNSFEELGGQPCSIFTEKQTPVEPGHRGIYFSMELIKQSLLMSCPKGGTVLDCFAGTGTTGAVALHMGYKFIGCEKDESKIPRIEERLKKLW